MHLQKINLSGTDIDLKISLSKRRSIAFIVHANLVVEVKAPLKAKMPDLIAKLQQRSNWVLKHHQRYKERGLHQPKQYIEGEEVYYLGQKYILRYGNKISGTVELSGIYIDISTKYKTPTALKTALKCWYKEQAIQIFSQRLEICFNLAKPFKIPRHKNLQIKFMKRRWGSCASNGIITLNPELITAPIDCIDYVIIHELCHLRYLNHSQRFYRLLEEILPNWKILKKELNKLGKMQF